MAQRGLDIELRKKFQGMEFRDFYEFAAKVTKYEELLRVENQRRKSSMGTYYQEVCHARRIPVRPDWRIQTEVWGVIQSILYTILY